MIKLQAGKIAVAALVLAVLEVAAANAVTAAPGEPRACMEELDRFCSDVPPGAGQILLCLEEHAAELSLSCRDRMQKAVKRTEEARQACAPDAARFCADVSPGQNRLIKCLSLHQDELTPACLQIGAWIRKPAERAASGKDQ